MNPSERCDVLSYDRIVVFFSGGKDSVACVLHLLECGVDPERIELHHHLVDGREGSSLMDWPVTDAYCQAFADAFSLKLYFSWKERGFERVQGSLYVTKNEDMANLFVAIQELRSRPWFPKSVRDIRAFRLEQWSDFTSVVKAQ